MINVAIIVLNIDSLRTLADSRFTYKIAINTGSKWQHYTHMPSPTRHKAGYDMILNLNLKTMLAVMKAKWNYLKTPWRLVAKKKHVCIRPCLRHQVSMVQKKAVSCELDLCNASSFIPLHNISCGLNAC